LNNPGTISDFAADIFRGKELNPRDDWDAPARDLVWSCLSATPGSLAVWEGWPERLDRNPPWSGEIDYFRANDGIRVVWDGPGGARSESRTPYLYVPSASNQESIANAFNARPYPTVCVLTDLPGEAQLPASPLVVSRSLLASLAAHATRMLVGAFDETGLVIWTRTEKIPFARSHVGRHVSDIQARHRGVGVQSHLGRACEAGDSLSFLIQHSRMRESAQAAPVR
jgi:hypothetical protein